MSERDSIYTRVHAEMTRISDSFLFHIYTKTCPCTIVISPESYDILHDVVHEFNSKYPYKIDTTVRETGRLLFDSTGIRRQKELFKKYPQIYITVNV